MHTISIDGQPFCRTGSLATVSQVLSAHRLGREAHLPITVELWGGFSTYTVNGTERRMGALLDAEPVSSTSTTSAVTIERRGTQ